MPGLPSIPRSPSGPCRIKRNKQTNKRPHWQYQRYRRLGETTRLPPIWPGFHPHSTLCKAPWESFSRKAGLPRSHQLAKLVTLIRNSPQPLELPVCLAARADLWLPGRAEKKIHIFVTRVLSNKTEHKTTKTFQITATSKCLLFLPHAQSVTPHPVYLH